MKPSKQWSVGPGREIICNGTPMLECQRTGEGHVNSLSPSAADDLVERIVTLLNASEQFTKASTY